MYQPTKPIFLLVCPSEKTWELKGFQHTYWEDSLKCVSNIILYKIINNIQICNITRWISWKRKIFKRKITSFVSNNLLQFLLFFSVNNQREDSERLSPVTLWLHFLIFNTSSECSILNYFWKNTIIDTNVKRVWKNSIR